MPTPPKNRYVSNRHNRAKKPTPKAAAAAEAEAAKKEAKVSVSTKPTMNISKVNVSDDDENDLPCNLCASMVTISGANLETTRGEVDIVVNIPS